MPRSAAELDALLEPHTDKAALIQSLAYATYAGDPTNNLVPAYIGQDCLDTSGNHWYRAHGLTNADWKKLNN